MHTKVGVAPFEHRHFYNELLAALPKTAFELLAPNLKISLLAGQEHGRTIPLADMGH
jgi:hypothetical protein